MSVNGGLEKERTKHCQVMQVVQQKMVVCWRILKAVGAGSIVRTSAVLGTASQKTSILMSPRLVWRVTDML